MTSKRSGGDLSVEKSRILAAYEASWRHWRAFIAEQQDQLQRHHADAGAFVDPLGMPLASASAPIKATLPGDVRQELMRVLELRRQETQAAADDAARKRGDPAPDRDSVFAEVLAHIDRELEGQVHPTGRALVWHEGRLHEFNHRRVLAQATDADYADQLSGDKAKQRRSLMLAGIGVVVILLVFVLLVITNVGDTPTTATAAVRSAQVGNAAVPLWDVTQLGIGGRQFPVAFARTGYPLLLCAPEASQAAIAPEATLVLTGTTSVRVYEIGTLAATSYDLMIANCADSPPTTLGTGVLTRALTSTALDPTGLRAITVVGADSDPATIPADRMQVTLTLDAALGDTGTLVLADGSRVAPSRATPMTQTVTLVYLVPLATSAQPAGWEVTRPGALPAVLPLTVPTPQSRALRLRTALVVDHSAVHAITSDTGAALQLTLTLHTTGAQSLALRATDLVLTQGRTTLPACDWTPPVLTSPVPVPLTATCAVTDARIPIEASLAGWRVRLSSTP